MNATCIDISIIIVSWNAKKYLQKCINSLQAESSGLSLEIIVVDNASSDGSPELVEKEYPDVISIRTGQNLGFARANNIGIDRCRGRYVCLVNSDVVVHKDCFSLMLNYMDKHPDVGVLGPKTFNGDGSLQHSCFSYPGVFNTLSRALALDTIFPSSAFFGKRLMKYWPHNEIRDVDMMNGCFLLVRREALEQVGKLDEQFFMYGEDIDWCKRFHDKKWKLRFFPDATITHFGGASSANAPVRFYLEMQRANLLYWKKHHPPVKWIAYIGIMVIHHAIRMFGRSLRFVFSSATRLEAANKMKRDWATILWYMGIKPHIATEGK